MDIRTGKKLAWAAFLSVIFMSILLYAVDWSHFSSIAGRVKIPEMFIAFSVLLAANIARSFRFHTLDHTGGRFSQWLIINKLYNFLTATLPGGVGEAATAYILKRYSSFNMLSAFRILLLSRVMDLAAISALLFCTAILISGSGHYRGTAIWLSTVLLILSITAMIPATEYFVLRLIQRIPGQNRVIKKAREKLGELADVSKKNLVRNTLGTTLFQSALVILGTAVSLYFIMLSINAGLTSIQTFYCFAVYAVLQMIPVQGIAGIGTQPARWVVALNAAGYSGPDIVAMGIVLHGTFYVFITLMGLGAFIAWLFSRKTRKFV